MNKLSFISDDSFLKHITPPGHPERPERLSFLMSHFRGMKEWDSFHHPSPVPATEEDILEVHSRGHLELVRNASLSGGGLIDEGDTHVVKESYSVGLLAAGAVLTGIDQVLGGKSQSAFCAVRPPGHHAERNRPMGFCLFNNVAIGARYVQKKHHVGKIAIVDWDVHHGNGTQNIFYSDNTVLFISLHQYPFYPGTGARNERGDGDGEGFTLNIPLPAGTGEETYISAFKDEIIPALTKFSPELLIISAGFDAHRDDPLAGMNLTENSFAEFTRLIQIGVPIVSVLEGGYNLRALANSVAAHISVLAES